MKKCGGCKDYFKDDDILIRTSVQSFCSKECLYRKSSPRVRKKKPNKIPKDVLKEVLIRDDNRCRSCGIKDRRSWPIAPHHIKYRSEGGGHTLANLIMLCVDCHDTAHSNKEVFQPFLVANLSTQGLLKLDEIRERCKEQRRREYKKTAGKNRSN